MNPLPPKYQPLDPHKFLHGLVTTTSHAYQAIPKWGLRGAWNVWRGTLESLWRNRTAQKPSQAQTTMLVISIYPDLLQVWYRFARQFVNLQQTKLVIVDSCGLIDPKLFPLARVVRFGNFSHARKIDYFIRHEIDTPYVWLCDDDSFIINANALTLAEQRLSSKACAVVSLQPRGWSLQINGQTRRAMGVYNILFSREIFVKENLSFSPIRTSNSNVGRGTGYYDTGDYANEQLLLRGYQVELAEGEDVSVKSFVGASSAMFKVLRSDAQQVLQDEIRVNPKVAAYHLEGLFCDIKISYLYQQLFDVVPQWQPPLTEQQIRTLAQMLPGDVSARLVDLFALYESKYQDLSRLAAGF